MAETFEKALWASHKASMGNKQPDFSSCLLLHCVMKRDPEGETLYNTSCYAIPLYYTFLFNKVYLLNY